jgi:hypothetical protein
MKDINDIRENDVFKFQYAPQEERGIDPYWAFEGTLVAMKDYLGKWTFVDTFWGIKGSDNRQFTCEQIMAEMLKGGDCKFYFNLDDVDEIKPYEDRYYADEDLFHLSRQHGCHDTCRHLYKRKGAEHSKEKMLAYLTETMRLARNKVNSANREIEEAAKKIAMIERGDLAIYI